MEAIVRELIEKEVQAARAFNRGDLNDVLAVFDTESFTGFSSTRFDRIHGLRDLKRTFEFYQKEADEIDYSISKPEVQVHGGCAVVTFYWHVKLRGAKLNETIKGRGTHVYVQEEGQWRVVHEHFSKSHRGRGDE